MPQMAPMPWVLLYILFLVALFIFISSVYFSVEVSKSEEPVSGEKTQSLIWPW